jgi:hypothetical protein
MIRERPPTDLHVTIDTPDGNHYRWAPDAHKAENVSGGVSFSTTMPGGFDTGQVTLARDPAIDYQDLGELSTLRFRGAGGVIAGEYRLESSPRTSGDSMQIQPGLVGWQSHLDDDSSASMVFVDISLQHWTGPSVARQNVLEGASIAPSGTSDIELDPSGDPALTTFITGAWAGKTRSEAWYDAGSANLIGKMYYSFTASAGVSPFDTNWSILLLTSSDDVGTGFNVTSNLLTVPSGYFTPTTPYGNAAVIQDYAVAAGTDSVDYKIFWGPLVVYGNHGLALSGPDPAGVLSSDVEAFAVGKWAPQIKFTTGSNGTIQPSTFVIPQLAFYTPTTSSDMIKTATQFELRPWAVWEGPTYYSNAYGALSAVNHRWLARSTECKLQAAGPQIQNLFNGVIATFQDAAGTTRYVGPPGSGADVEDASLLDTDPENPANELGIRRWGPTPPLSLGLASSDSAIALGQAYLQQQLELNQAGQASHVGYIQEAATGVLFPAWAMRAGDQVSYVDASDRGFRKIVSTSYDDASRTNSIQLDSPPETMSALLLRYGVELTNGSQSS